MKPPFTCWIGAAAVVGALGLGPVAAANPPRPALAAPPALAAAFVQACDAQLALTEAQRVGLRTYLEQEIEYMNVQAANHSAAEVAELIPAEREQLQRVAGRLLSPGQLRQFRDLEATPQMKAYLKRMSLY